MKMIPDNNESARHHARQKSDKLHDISPIKPI